MWWNIWNARGWWCVCMMSLCGYRWQKTLWLFTWICSGGVGKASPEERVYIYFLDETLHSSSIACISDLLSRNRQNRLGSSLRSKNSPVDWEWAEVLAQCSMKDLGREEWGFWGCGRGVWSIDSVYRMSYMYVSSRCRRDMVSIYIPCACGR